MATARSNIDTRLYAHSPMDGEAEQLVALGFRCALTCLRNLPDAADGTAASRLSGLVTNGRLPQSSRSSFLAWGLSIECSAIRPVTILPVTAPSFCRDERLSAALVAAVQHRHCPALIASIAALLGTSDVGRVLAATGEVAEMLRGSGKVLEARKDDVTQALAHKAPFTDRSSRRLN